MASLWYPLWGFRFRGMAEDGKLVFVHQLGDEPVARRVFPGATDLEEYRPPGEVLSEIRRAGYAQAAEWALRESGAAGAAGSYRGVSILEGLVWDLHYHVIDLMMAAELYRGAIRGHVAQRVLAVGSGAWLWLARAVALQEGCLFEARPSGWMGSISWFDDRRAAAPSFEGRGATGTSLGPEGPRPPECRGKRVLMLAPSRGAALVAGAVANEMSSRGMEAPVILGPTGVREVFAGAQVTFASLEDVPAGVPPAVQRGEVFCANLAARVLGASRASVDVFEWRGIDLWPGVRRRLRYLLGRRGPYAVQMADLAAWAIERYEPGAVVVTGFEETILDCVFTRAAQAEGLPCLNIQDGDFIDVPPRRLKADLMAIQGESTRRSIVQEDQHRAVVTGQPRYDGVELRSVSTGPTRGVAVLATDPGTGWGSTYDKLEVERLVIQEMARNPDWRLIIKLHPQDRGAATREILRRQRADNIEITQEQDAHVLMDSCDVWICMASTTAQEAVMHGKPTLIANYTGCDLLKEFVDAGMGRFLERPGDVLPGLREVTAREFLERMERGRVAFLARRTGVLDGRASARVVDLIRGMTADA